MKFWNKAENEIYIFGELVSERWDESDVTARSFVEDLRSFNGADIEIHINSPGGDVFTAVAIGNVIKNYNGAVTAVIDGLCASAATLIACSCKSVKMAKNAVYMIHKPSVGLMGFFNSSEIEKIQSGLAAIEGTILTTYASRTDKITSEMLESELYMTAEEALGYGLIDEVMEESDAEYDNRSRLMIVNKGRLDCKGLDVAKLEAALKRSRMEVRAVNEVEKAIATERARVSELQSKLGESEAGDKILNLAIKEGKSYAEVSAYVDAVKSVKSAPAEVAAMIKDQMQSGAEGVAGSSEADKKQAAFENLVKMANNLNGVKK